MGLPLFKTPKEDKLNEIATPQQERASAPATSNRTEAIVSPELGRLVARQSAAPDRSIDDLHARREHLRRREAELQARVEGLQLSEWNRHREIIVDDPVQLLTTATLPPSTMATERVWIDAPRSEVTNQNPAAHLQYIYVPMETTHGLDMLGEHVATEIRQELGRQSGQRAEQSEVAIVTNDDGGMSNSPVGPQSPTSYPMGSSNTVSSDRNFLGRYSNLSSVWAGDPSTPLSTYATIPPMEPIVESLSIAMAPESLRLPHNIDRAATPPVRSAAPSPQAATSHVRDRQSLDIHTHHPDCPCIDCWAFYRL
ncbi:hypothetical protein BKA65DRAFT_555169 [Rhexocercosporidium sp. MPI-PUGE-AT-0058]|nr:hypothetical protein BKA65DRAFT_555169 [Rhexocercosporidium sp. MPI-PUGE-AT-0058]